MINRSRARGGLGRALLHERSDTAGLGPEEEQAREESQRVEHEPDHDPVVAEAVEVGLDDEENAGHERHERRGNEDAVGDPLDVLAERGEPRGVARHRGAEAEELHHQRTADPDDRDRDVHEDEELEPGHPGQSKPRIRSRSAPTMTLTSQTTIVAPT
jgi:hypothetical protein